MKLAKKQVEVFADAKLGGRHNVFTYRDPVNYSVWQGDARKLHRVTWYVLSRVGNGPPEILCRRRTLEDLLTSIEQRAKQQEAIRGPAPADDPSIDPTRRAAS